MCSWNGQVSSRQLGSNADGGWRIFGIPTSRQKISVKLLDEVIHSNMNRCEAHLMMEARNEPVVQHILFGMVEMLSMTSRYLKFLDAIGDCGCRGSGRRPSHGPPDLETRFCSVEVGGYKVRQPEIPQPEFFRLEPFYLNFVNLKFVDRCSLT
jgi:hypothetical protein